MTKYLLAAGVLVAATQPMRARTAHIGDSVVFVHYIPPYSGELRAAKLLQEPGRCPPATYDDETMTRVVQLPARASECSNLRFYVSTAGEQENPTLVLDAEDQPVGHHTKNGDDFRFHVPHDPSGKMPRSWHVWGEAPGED